MEHILAPNLTYFSALHTLRPGARPVAEMFHDFSAPKLQSIRFDGIPLLPLLTLHDLPSMFPQLESVMFEDCGDVSAFIDLLKPPQPKRPSSLQKAAKYPPKRRKVENLFPKLKELAISDMENWTSLQAAIESRRKNGDKSLRTIHLPKDDVTEGTMRHITQWLPKQGIELILYEPGDLAMYTPPEFQDDLYDEEFCLFDVIMDESELGYDEDDDVDYEDYADFEDYEYWRGSLMDRHEYELPSNYPGAYSDLDDEEEEEIGDGFYDT